MEEKKVTKVALISDTHGLLRESVKEKLRDADLILHAGDVGDISVIEELRKFAHVVAVAGNMDYMGPASCLPQTECVEVAGKQIYILHDLFLLDISPEESSTDIVVHGHTHKPDEFERNGVMYINPGSAGPRRYSYPISMAYLMISEEKVTAEFITLDS